MATKKYYDNSYYVHGNTVRKHHTIHQLNMPSSNREQKKKKSPKVVPAPAWSIKSLLFFITAVAIAFGICVSYLYTTQSITVMSKRINTLESEILDLKIQNDEAYNKINTLVDLDYIYEIAVNELGMVHVKGSQVIPYISKKSSSVRQYKEIPEKTEGTSRILGE